MKITLFNKNVANKNKIQKTVFYANFQIRNIVIIYNILERRVFMMITEKQVIDFLKTKDNDYIQNLIQSFDFHSDDIYHKEKICPRCGSSLIKKNGKDKYDHQRYYCKDCHKSFSDRTGTLLYWSHLTLNQWKKFIDCEVSKLSLEDEAHFVGLSKTTCFYIRHKLYHAVSGMSKINQ